MLLKPYNILLPQVNVLLAFVIRCNIGVVRLSCYVFTTVS